MDRNNVRPLPISINTKFLNSLQPEWSKYITMTRQNYNLKEVAYDQLFDTLSQFEPHVNASKAKKAARNHDPLALVAHSNVHSSQSHTIIDYEEDYQGELRGDAQEDKLTTAMMMVGLTYKARMLAIRIKSLLDAVWIAATHVFVNAAQMDLLWKERQRQEKASLNYIANLYDEVQARIDADHELVVRWTQKEHEKYIVDERAKLLAEYFENRKKQLAEERAAAIRNKPPTKSQLRSLMMTYLKHTGRYKHAQLNKKNLEEIQVLYIKEQERIADFVPIGSEEDERLIQKMNKKVVGEHKEKVLKEPDSTKVKVEQEGTKESTKKRPGRRLKIKATKKSRMQKTDSDLEEEEHLKTFLKLVPDKEGIIDYEVLEKRFPIINWESKFYHLDRHGAECIYYRIFRSDESSRWIKTFPEMVTMFYRLDLRKDDIWKNQEEWILRSWNFYENCGVHTLILEDGTEIHMLAERKYPLIKETLERMMSLKLIVESTSESAYNLLRFIQKQCRTDLRSLYQKPFALGLASPYVG
ncbi:hypothetical protein Tco_0471441 [Tanacetum coccineum]